MLPELSPILCRIILRGLAVDIIKESDDGAIITGVSCPPRLSHTLSPCLRAFIFVAHDNVLTTHLLKLNGHNRNAKHVKTTR